MQKRFAFVKKLSLSVWIILLIMVIFLSNFILSQFNFSFDATFDRAYSLSPGTKQFLSSLENDVQVTLYYSKRNPKLPIPLSNFARRTFDSLNQIVKASDGKLQLTVIDPEPDTDEEIWAVENGITATPIEGVNFFLGAVFSQGTKDVVINIFDPAREKFIEYDVARAIYDLTTAKKAVVGVLSPMDYVLGDYTNDQAPTQYFMSELRQIYDLQRLDYNNTAVIPTDVDLLLILHPRAISVHTEYAIDQYLLGGGKLAVVTDPFFRNDPQQQNASGTPEISSSNLFRLFRKWGLNNHNEDIIGDRDFAAVVNSGEGRVPYSLWMVGDSSLLSDQSPVTANVKDTLFVESGAFRVEAEPNLSLVPIAQSSANAGFINSYTVRFRDPIAASYQIQYGVGVWNLIAFLQGSFESAFDKAPDIDTDQITDPAYIEVLKDRPAHKNKADTSSRVLLINDFDFLVDNVAVTRGQAFGQTFFQLQNDNLKLFFAALNDLLGNELLSLIAPKSVTNRPFVTFRDMQLAAQEKYQQNEEALQKELETLRESIQKLQPESGASTFDLPESTLQEIRQFQQKELETKKALRDTRKLLREDIESLITWLTMFNLFLVPASLTVIGVLVYLRRMKRTY